MSAPSARLSAPADNGSFEADLTAATLASERRRVALQGWLLVVCLGAYCMYLLAKPAIGAKLWEGLRRQSVAVFTIYGVAIAYEALLWVAAGARLRSGRRIPPVFPYVNAVVEVSFVTALLWTASHVFDPVRALFFPPSMLYLVVILLSTLRLDAWLCAFTGLVTAAEYFALALPIVWRAGGRYAGDVLVQPTHHVMRAGMFAVGGLAAAFIAAQIRRQIEQALRSQLERDRAVSVFGQHVSPQVAGRLLAQAADLSPETREVCVMFLDIRDFTRFSHGRSPGEVMAYLNRLFNPMIDIVNRHGGIINKFLGDGFMAVFGAPVEDGEGSRHAARAALELVARVEEMSRSGEVPATRVGIGLHTGRAVTGNVGSSRRKEYTVIGDVVNLASRIEQLNKQYGSQVLASAEACAGLPPGQFELVALGPVRVKGREADVEVLRLA